MCKPISRFCPNLFPYCMFITNLENTDKPFCKIDKQFVLFVYGQLMRHLMILNNFMFCKYMCMYMALLRPYEVNTMYMYMYVCYIRELCHCSKNLKGSAFLEALAQREESNRSGKVTVSL